MFGNLFNKSSLGLDMGDKSIKFVELFNTKDGLRLGRHGEREITNKGELGKILLSLKKDFGLKSVHLSLPDKEMQNIKDYLSVLRNSGIKVKSFELSIQAIIRSLLKRGDSRDLSNCEFWQRKQRDFYRFRGYPGLSFTGLEYHLFFTG